MRTVIQRVSEAGVDVAEETVGSIGVGLLVLIGIEEADREPDIDVAIEKVATMRIFSDRDGRMNLSVADVEGSVLVVSQFTLIADTRKGRRPSFVRAARPEVAVPLIERFEEGLRGRGLGVESGRFGAMMQVSLVNDGPVTIVLDITDGKVV